MATFVYKKYIQKVFIPKMVCNMYILPFSSFYNSVNALLYWIGKHLVLAKYVFLCSDYRVHSVFHLMQVFFPTTLSCIAFIYRANDPMLYSHISATFEKLDKYMYMTIDHFFFILSTVPFICIRGCIAGLFNSTGILSSSLLCHL